MSAGLAYGLAAAGALIAIALVWLWLRRRRRSSIADAVRAIAVDRLDDILVPDGMGGEIHVEHLLLTARGIVVLNIKRYIGVIFASERMDQWTAMSPDGRSVFPNPLGNLLDRIAAVRQLVRDVDVAGFVVFPAEADFSKGQPGHVILPDELGRQYAKPDQGDIGRLTEAFAPSWEKIRAAVRPA